MTAASVRFDLSDDIAVVTGVQGKLGRVWTSALLGAGATVVGIDLDGAMTSELADIVDDHPRERFTLVRADLRDRASLEHALAECRARHGNPTVLVNNAGVDQPPSASAAGWRFGELPDEQSARVLDVNAHGTLRVCQVFGTPMTEQGRGSVINIGSLYGSNAPDPRLYDHIPMDPPFLKPPAYGMSKAGVGALTRYLAALWGSTGVRVNTLSPGGVLGDQDAQFREKFSARVPLRRLATERDLIGPLLFLASEASSYVTGTELLVDGGYDCW